MTPRSFYEEFKKELMTRGVPLEVAIVFPLVMVVLFGIVVLNNFEILPNETIIQHFIINTASPTAPSFLLAHYVPGAYGDWSFESTLVALTAAMCGIILLWYGALPALGWNPPPTLLRNSLLCIFLLLPIPFSGFLLAVARVADVHYIYGFSGIEAAAEGLLVFLILAALVQASRTRVEEGREGKGLLVVGAVVFLVGLLYQYVSWEFGKPPGFTVPGYLAGVTIPFVLLRVSKVGDGRRKRVLGVVMGAMFVVLSLCWVLV